MHLLRMYIVFVFMMTPPFCGHRLLITVLSGNGV